MAPPSLETVSVSVEGSIGIIKYDRPKHANALSQQAMGDLLAALTWADNDPRVRLVVLTGEGKFFSAGMDLVGIPDEGPVLPDESVRRLSWVSLL